MSAGKKSVRRTIRQIRHAGRSRADRLFGAAEDGDEHHQADETNPGGDQGDCHAKGENDANAENEHPNGEQYD